MIRSRFGTLSAAALTAALALAPCAPANGQETQLALAPEGRQAGYDVYRVRDRSGRELTLLAEGPVDERTLLTLQGLAREWDRLQYLRVRSVRALSAGGTVDVLLVPESFVFEGQDLARFLPAGLRFHIDGAASYDFRMLVGHYFLRLHGPYETEEALARRLAEAASTPAAFLKADTLEYVSDRFAALEGRIQEAEQRGTEAFRGLEAKVQDLEKRGLEAVSETRAALGEIQQGTEALKQQAEALSQRQARDAQALEELRGELDKVKATASAQRLDLVEADVRALRQGLGELGADVQAVRTAVVILQSRSGFGRKGVDRTAVERLVALKRANPGLTQADAVKALKAEGISMSTRDVSLIYAVFFSEF